MRSARAPKNSNVIPLRVARIAGVRRRPAVGRIVGFTKGRFIVDYPGNPHGALPARTVLSPAVLSRACKRGTHPEVMLAFEEERADRPVILGLLHSERSGSEAPEAHERPEAIVDGKRVVLEGEDEIVLKCGKAVLMMRRNGRVVVRGTSIETDSEGVNRVTGGTVEIN